MRVCVCECVFSGWCGHVRVHSQMSPLLVIGSRSFSFSSLLFLWLSIFVPAFPLPFPLTVASPLPFPRRPWSLSFFSSSCSFSSFAWASLVILLSLLGLSGAVFGTSQAVVGSLGIFVRLSWALLGSSGRLLGLSGLLLGSPELL